MTNGLDPAVRARLEGWTRYHGITGQDIRAALAALDAQATRLANLEAEVQRLEALPHIDPADVRCDSCGELITWS